MGTPARPAAGRPVELAFIRRGYGGYRTPEWGCPAAGCNRRSFTGDTAEIERRLRTGQVMTTRTSPVPTVSPGETRTSETVPAFSALMWFSIFMASSTTTA
jgi:hypothetical protein